jgi:hypothetical protein
MRRARLSLAFLLLTLVTVPGADGVSDDQDESTTIHAKAGVNDTASAATSARAPDQLVPEPGAQDAAFIGETSTSAASPRYDPLGPQFSLPSVDSYGYQPDDNFPFAGYPTYDGSSSSSTYGSSSYDAGTSYTEPLAYNGYLQSQQQHQAAESANAQAKYQRQEAEMARRQVAKDAHDQQLALSHQRAAEASYEKTQQQRLAQEAQATSAWQQHEVSKLQSWRSSMVDTFKHEEDSLKQQAATQTQERTQLEAWWRQKQAMYKRQAAFLKTQQDTLKQREDTDQKKFSVSEHQLHQEVGQAESALHSEKQQLHQQALQLKEKHRKFLSWKEQTEANLRHEQKQLQEYLAKGVATLHQQQIKIDHQLEVKRARLQQVSEHLVHRKAALVARIAAQKHSEQLFMFKQHRIQQRLQLKMEALRQQEHTQHMTAIDLRQQRQALQAQARGISQATSASLQRLSMPEPGVEPYTAYPDVDVAATVKASQGDVQSEQDLSDTEKMPPKTSSTAKDANLQKLDAEADAIVEEEAEIEAR